MRYLFLLLFCCAGTSMFAQKVITKRIKVGFDKTTFVMFDSPVDWFDVGSEDVLFSVTQKPNIVKIKGSVEKFHETNITILTKDGKYYSLITSYNNNPDTLNYIMTESGIPVLSTPSDGQITQKKIDTENSTDADYVMKQAHSLSGFTPKGVIGYKIGVAITGLYVHKGMMYFRFSFSNKSPLDYNLDDLLFSIQPKRNNSKTSTSQDAYLVPATTKNVVKQIKAGQDINDVFYAFKSFSVSNNNVFKIQMVENENGNRNLEIVLTAKKLLQAIIIR